MFGPGLLGLTACEAVLERQFVAPSAGSALIAKAVCTSDGLHVTLDLIPVRLNIAEVGITTASGTVDDRIHLRANCQNTLGLVTATVHVAAAAVLVNEIFDGILELRCEPIKTVEPIVSIVSTVSIFPSVAAIVDDVDLTVEAACSILQA